MDAARPRRRHVHANPDKLAETVKQMQYNHNPRKIQSASHKVERFSADAGSGAVCQEKTDQGWPRGGGWLCCIVILPG